MLATFGQIPPSVLREGVKHNEAPIEMQCLKYLPSFCVFLLESNTQNVGWRKTHPGQSLKSGVGELGAASHFQCAQLMALLGQHNQRGVGQPVATGQT